jgi:hypothetical protein
VVEALKHFKRKGVDLALGLAASGKGVESAAAFLLQDALRENGACGVSGAQKQHVIHAIHHANLH